MRHRAVLLLTGLLCACANPPQKHPVHNGAVDGGYGLQDTTVVGVISPNTAPLIDTSGLPYLPKTAAEGALAGTAAGGLALADLCLDITIIFYPAIVACPFVAAAGAFGGAVFGADLADESNPAQVERNTSIDAYFAMTEQTRVQDALRARIVTVTRSGSLSFVDLGARDVEYFVEPTGLDYPALGVEVVLEVEVSHVLISIAPPPYANTMTYSYALTARARSRMFLASNAAELATHSHFFIGPSYTLQEWQAEDSKNIRAALTRAIEFFAADMIAKCCPRSAFGIDETNRSGRQQ